jgi:hypothetical protein
MLKSLFFTLTSSIILVLVSCQKLKETNSVSEPERSLFREFRSYWYQGSAEINTYELIQERYGESRQGEAVLIFVTEDFLKEEQVKANQRTPDVIPILKLNSTKSFQTGIYPYSIMQSTFYPVKEFSEGIKVTSSVQEWCGQTYTQLNNKDGFNITIHSYFEGEADQNLKLEETVLENSLWAVIRINPEELPQGSFQAIPDFSYMQMYHQPMKAYQAQGTITQDSLNHYQIVYPELKRMLTINFDKEHPYSILSWEETHTGTGQKTLAKRKAKVQLPYWQMNKAKDSVYRDSLKLK